MIDLILGFVLGASITNVNGFILYWIPVIITGVYYIFESYDDVKSDLKDRSNYLKGDNLSYTPEITVGTLVARTIASFIPIVNILIVAFCALPYFLGGFFEKLTKFFNVPLVPKKVKQNANKTNE